MTTAPSRKPYQGVVQIFQFNWRAYFFTGMSVAAAILVLPFLPPIGRTALLLGVAPAIFWIASSLLVSHYLYDRFPLYDLTWISRSLALTPKRWVNIHCGLDETSGLLAAIFPESTGQVVDIYDPRIMTETSIQIARQLKHPVEMDMMALYDALPISDASLDAVFLLFAAHELRQHGQRVRLFQEVARILVPGGDLILMEHSRDWWNFLAFGPGFLHFFSRREWRRTALDAGLALQAEFSRTPFVHVYHLRRSE
jgi:SAM-dependent methyltransferase